MYSGPIQGYMVKIGRYDTILKYRGPCTRSSLLATVEIPLTLTSCACSLVLVICGGGSWTCWGGGAGLLRWDRRTMLTMIGKEGQSLMGHTAFYAHWHTFLVVNGIKVGFPYQNLLGRTVMGYLPIAIQCNTV